MVISRPRRPRTGGPAPVRRFLPDVALPLDQAAEAYRTTDERNAVKALPPP
ncbi:hypothetical protein [Dactylosporangium sp. NPDC051541]|uniref:hypothetical protein n=1 Tax=Dactylosporangium sp. NPDC051541 TaxID=3363977 RepID=UPI0037B55A09